MKPTIINRCLLSAVILCLSAWTAFAQPVAGFTANVTSGCAPLRVQFTNTSTGSIEWDWNFGDGTVSDDQNPSHLYTVPGTYTVVLAASGSGATDTETKTGYITVTGFEIHVAVTNASCGASNGSIDVTVNSTAPPVTYIWTNGATSEDLFSLAPGDYRFTATDGSGCQFHETYHVVSTGNITLTGTVNHVVPGVHQGSISVAVSGGSAPYTYAWSNGESGPIVDGLSAGTYCVTVTDGNGCVADKCFLIETSNGCNLTVTGHVESVVPGVHLGNIHLTVTGGTAPYTYAWSNGESGPIVDGLPAGTYCVTVTDANNCVADKCFLVETATGCHLTITGSVRDATSSTADNGRIEPFVSGGTLPYTYVWSTGSHDRIIDGLTIGTYCVTVTDDNACTADHCFVVEVAPTNCTSLTITGVVNDVTVPGAHNGIIQLTISGGTSPYTYTWSNGAHTKNIDNLEQGQYCVTVTDVNGCVKDKCFVVEVANACGNFVVLHPTVNATCGAANGSINLNVSGGTLPYTYVWSNGSHDDYIQNLAAGNYRVTVEDAGGCRYTETFTITNSNNNLSLSANVSPVTASGAMDGAINLTVTGGTAPYTYHWQFGGTTEDLSGLEVGLYCVLVTDANGCSEDGCYNVTGVGCVNFTVTGSETSVGCGGTPGSINVTVTSGTPPYHYIWSTGDTTEDISGLTAGTYSLTVEDSGPCRKVRTFTVGYAGGFQITGTVTPSIPGAATGSITIAMTGGTGPYSFVWTPVGATTQNIDHLAPGQYCVLVTDANGCIEDQCFTVGTSGGCGSFYVTAHDDRHLCEPGTVTLEANAHEGEEPYTYSWSPANGVSSPSDRITQATVSDTTVFIVTATDDNGCTATDTVVVYVTNLSSGATGVAFDSITICKGDSVQLAAFGGNDYYWDPGNGLSDRNSATPWASPEETKDYSVIVSNGGCHSNYTVHVEVDEDCVWPGDANHDGVANNQDVLVLGIGYGISGFPRPGATNNWAGQFCPDWFLALASGPNLKHVDCDGDATIAAADTLPIFLNYGLTHSKGSGSSGLKFVDPELYFDIPEDTALAGQEIEVPVYLGTDALQVSNFYGIAFSVNYDNAIVEENTMHFAPVNSFAGNTGDLLSFDFDLYGNSKLDVALTRFNRTSTSGFGQIGVLHFTMKDDISGKDFLVRELTLSFSDVRAIDNNENDVLLFYADNSMFVKQEILSIGEIKNAFDVTVYPNPASELLQVELKNKNLIEEILLFDIVGKEMLRVNGNGNRATLDLKNVAEGNYLLVVKSGGSKVAKKITVVK